MLFGNAVKLAQMTFCLIPKVLYPIDVVLPFGKMCTVVDTQVAKLTDIQHIIALMTICCNVAGVLSLFCVFFVTPPPLSPMTKPAQNFSRFVHIPAWLV